MNSMLKSGISTIVLCLGLAGWSGANTASGKPTTITPEKTYNVLNPDNPVQGSEMTLKVILGMYPNSCVPKYETSVSTTVLEMYPPIIKVSLTYKEMPEITDLMCADVLTEYGPVFKLGTAQTGTYQIYLKDSLIRTFRVSETKDTLTAPELNRFFISPAQPVEGETVTIKQIKGYGSSSCAPVYTSSMELRSDANGLFEYSMSYVVKNSSEVNCTDDYVPYGPEWEVHSVKAGYYLFRLQDGSYCKLVVSRKPTVPAFTVASLSGKVNRVVDGQTVPDVQCTVAVVSYSLVNAVDLPAHEDSDGKLIAPDSAVRYEISKFTTTTGSDGSFSLKNIPVSILMNNTSIVAVHGNYIGYGSIPFPLQENMTVNILLYDNTAVDDAVKRADNAEIIELFRSQNGTSVIDKHTVTKSLSPVISAMGSGFQFVNPLRQKIAIAAFNLNGTKIWTAGSGMLAEGTHNFHIASAPGIVILKINGETFTMTQRLTIRK